MRVQLTEYGYKSDPDGDTLTEQGWGAWGNKLTPTSCALKRTTGVTLGAKPRCKIQITIGPQTHLYRWWDDVIPETDPDARCDLYQPKGFDKTLPDYADIQVIADDGNSPANPV